MLMLIKRRYFISYRVYKSISLASLIDGVSAVYYCADEIRGAKLNAS